MMAMAENWRDADRREARAIAHCASCPVQAQCSTYEDKHPTQWGVRAGMTADQRIARRAAWRVSATRGPLPKRPSEVA